MNDVYINVIFCISIFYNISQVFLGLTDGSLLVYSRRPTNSSWQLTAPVTVQLSDSAPVTAMLPLSAQLYAAVADTVMVLDCSTLTVTVSRITVSSDADCQGHGQQWC